ncbi:hypothetical protein ACHHYP_01427 [Achlya hypogyna]|uniref:Uncharacterized protein n=1 Tax=Achlya hypogyna TaxID=1202772 RepID=A0A1V9Z8M8_ACHHY|nr:hypothetical protein ACHHYP_01427 [Achlya hypogyna]
MDAADACLEPPLTPMQEIVHKIVLEVLRRHGLPVLDNGLFVQPQSVTDDQIVSLYPVSERYVEKTLHSVGKLLGPSLRQPSCLTHMSIHTKSEIVGAPLPGSYAKLVRLVEGLTAPGCRMYYEAGHEVHEITCEATYMDFVLQDKHDIITK